MKPKSISIFSLILFLLFNLACIDRNNYRAGVQTITADEESPLVFYLENTLKNVNDSVNLAFRGKELFTSSMVKQLYVENQYLPIWTTGMEPNHYARELMSLFAKSSFYGLDTSFYHPKNGTS